MQRMIGFMPLLISMVISVFFIAVYAFNLHSNRSLKAMRVYEIPTKSTIETRMPAGKLSSKFTTARKTRVADGIYLPPAIRNMPIVNPHNFKYILNPTKACSGDVEVVICVPVARDKAEARRVVAETWGSYAYNKLNKAVLLFFLGNATKEEPSSVQKSIEDEFKQNQNIVQEDYLDVYRNLSLKSMSIIKWVGKFCHNARYVIKADADIYSNMTLLVKDLQDTQSKHEKAVYDSGYKPDSKSFDALHFVMGKLVQRAQPRRGNSKWKATVEEFPGKFYPNYLSGTCYSMPVNTARYLFQVSIRTKLFWLEDIFVTGIVATTAHVARISNDKHQNINRIIPILGCNFKNVASSHTYTVEEIRKVHTELYDPNAKC